MFEGIYCLIVNKCVWQIIPLGYGSWKEGIFIFVCVFGHFRKFMSTFASSSGVCRYQCFIVWYIRYFINNIFSIVYIMSFSILYVFPARFLYHTCYTLVFWVVLFGKSCYLSVPFFKIWDIFYFAWVQAYTCIFELRTHKG